MILSYIYKLYNVYDIYAHTNIDIGFFIANVFHKTDNIRFEVIKHSIVKCL